MAKFWFISASSVDLSTKSKKVFDDYQLLDQNQNYVFSYWRAYPGHFNFEDTYNMVTGFNPAMASADFTRSGLPYEFDVEGGKVGHYVLKGATRKGRIIEVMRWDTYILNRPLCTFVLEQGGTRHVRNPNGNGLMTIPNETVFNIYSEEGCRYVEAILPYGLDVNIDYSQAYVTIDRYDHFAHHISIESVPGTSDPSGVATAGRNALTQEMLADPEFQKGVANLIDQHLSRAGMLNNPPKQ